MAKQRKEEVDLETGKRKSWVETTEFEVLDLTGDTPAKKRLSLSKSPLKEVNKAKEVDKVKKALATKPPAAPAPAENSGTCPMCRRMFKGEKGVGSHRRAKNSACHPNKENQARSQVAPSAAVTPVSTRRIFSNTVPDSPSNDDSIILIADTPVPGNRRVSLRRSIRMA